MLNIDTMSQEQKERYNLLVEKQEWKDYVLSNLQKLNFLIGYTYKFGSKKALAALKGTRYGELQEGQLCDLIYILEYSLVQYNRPYDPKYFQDQVIDSLVAVLGEGA